MAGKRIIRRWLSIALLAAAHNAAAQSAAPSADQSDADLPSAELLLFLAEWSDESGWLDPLALDQAMTHSAEADTTTGVAPMNDEDDHDESEHDADEAADSDD
ncbi:MAG: hypothetical protein Tsb002_25990 [Wenzhouxiangellaceae bacterium]